MNVKLKNTKTQKTVVFGEVESVEIAGGVVKIIDIYDQERTFNINEWKCVCSRFAVCCDCGKNFFFDDETCAVYRDEFLCDKCYQDKYGFCNECGELNKYTDMNEDIICKGCE